MNPKTTKNNPRLIKLIPGSLILCLGEDGTFLQFEMPDGRGAAINLDHVFEKLAIAKNVYRDWNRELRKKKGVK